jgi:hypothetical protein
MSLISTVHQTRVLTNILLSKKQQSLAKFSKYRQVENNSDLSSDPMNEMVQYKYIQSNQAEQNFNENINETTEFYKENQITHTDLKLVNQVCPGLLDPGTSNMNSQNNTHDYPNIKYGRNQPRSPKDEDEDEKEKDKSQCLVGASKHFGLPEIANVYDGINSIEYDNLNIESLHAKKNDSFKNQTTEMIHCKDRLGDCSIYSNLKMLENSKKVVPIDRLDQVISISYR